MESRLKSLTLATVRDIKITIKDPERESSVIITISRDATVEELKKKYAAAAGQSKPWNGYRFEYGTAKLTDASKIDSIPGMIPGMVLKVSFQEPPLIVNVRGLDGRTKKISALKSWTVRRLKEEYALWLGQGWDNVVMLYRAKHLKDSDLLSVYNIETDGFIQANVRSVGGSDNEE